MSKPDLTRIPAFYHGYISLVKEDNLSSAFRVQETVIKEFLSAIPAGLLILPEMIPHPCLDLMKMNM